MMMTSSRLLSSVFETVRNENAQAKNDGPQRVDHMLQELGDARLLEYAGQRHLTQKMRVLLWNLYRKLRLKKCR